MTIQEKLCIYYIENKRTLPWRESKDEYNIWISEIMLQQTRVESVIPYYHSFIKEFPTFEDLAGADEEKLTKVWQGLGYYRRVFNMQKCAEKVLLLYQGQFPRTYEEIIKLPGIGDYTAGAILSIAYDLPYAAVDGNVIRIYSRLYELFQNASSEQVKKKIKQFIESAIPHDSGNFNQALMDMGATICLPRNPKCDLCPLKEDCLAFLHKTTDIYPIKAKKSVKKSIKKAVFIIKNEHNQFVIRKRDAIGLLANMYEFIQVDSSEKDSFLTMLKGKTIILSTEYLCHYNHVFSHIIWDMDCYVIKVKNYFLNENEIFATKEEIDSIYALPKAFSYFYTILLHPNSRKID